MQPRRPLHAVCMSTALAVQLTACGVAMLPRGGPVSTDPDPNPARVYRAPSWDASTTARAEVITTLTWTVLMCIPVFPQDRWCSNFDASRMPIGIGEGLHPPAAFPFAHFPRLRAPLNGVAAVLLR